MTSGQQMQRALFSQLWSLHGAISDRCDQTLAHMITFVGADQTSSTDWRHSRGQFDSHGIKFDWPVDGEEDNI